jgi:hypothetical protein
MHLDPDSKFHTPEEISNAVIPTWRLRVDRHLGDCCI